MERGRCISPSCKQKELTPPPPIFFFARALHPYLPRCCWRTQDLQREPTARQAATRRRCRRQAPGRLRHQRRPCCSTPPQMGRNRNGERMPQYQAPPPPPFPPHPVFLSLGSIDSRRTVKVRLDMTPCQRTAVRAPPLLLPTLPLKTESEMTPLQSTNCRKPVGRKGRVNRGPPQNEQLSGCPTAIPPPHTHRIISFLARTTPHGPRFPENELRQSMPRKSSSER